MEILWTLVGMNRCKGLRINDVAQFRPSKFSEIFVSVPEVHDIFRVGYFKMSIHALAGVAQ